MLGENLTYLVPHVQCMPPNSKLISIHVTSSISHVCLQEVVGMAKSK